VLTAALRSDASRRAAPPKWVVWLVVAMALTVIVAIVLMILVPLAAVPDAPTAADRRRLLAEASIRSTILQSLAGLVVVAGLGFTARSLYLSRETHLTDRLATAVDQLGHAKTEVRMGGIYSLRRLAGNSRIDRAMIAKLLTGYLTVHARPGTRPARGSIEPDVQTALSVLVVLESA
jgi:hypothetical protein